MFSGRDPECKKYRRRAHLASIVALLGLPPRELIVHSSVRDKFFSIDGAYSEASFGEIDEYFLT